MDTDRAARHLEHIRQARDELRQKQRDTSAELADAIRDAQAADIPFTEICHLAGVSRQGAYKLLEREQAR